MANVEFTYEGQYINIQCNENDKLEKIIQNFCIQIQKSKEQLHFLYSGQIISNYNLTFIELANQFDKARKILSIIVINSYYNNKSLIQKETIELKEKLDKADKTISTQKSEIQELKYQITMNKSESIKQINNLMNIIEKKDEQIYQLKEKLKNIYCPKCKEKLEVQNNFLSNESIKIKTFHLINNTIPIVNIKNSPSWINKYSIRVLRSCFMLEGYQILSLKNDTLIGVLEGPPNTAYEDGYFLFKMIFPSDFIFKPPKFVFITDIFHPNISNGLVSVDVLMHQWSPAICSFDKIIYSVQSLLDDPNPDDFINEEAAKLYKEDKNGYNRTVREYTSLYANYSKFEEGVKNLNLKIQTAKKGEDFKYLKEN